MTLSPETPTKATARKRLWISECGLYYATPAPCYQPAFDVVEINGDRVWLWVRKNGLEYAEFPRLVSSWTNLGRSAGKWTKRWIPAFELGFSDVNQRKKIKPLTGNIIVKDYSAKFFTNAVVKRSVYEAVDERIALLTQGDHA